MEIEISKNYTPIGEELTISIIHLHLTEYNINIIEQIKSNDIEGIGIIYQIDYSLFTEYRKDKDTKIKHKIISKKIMEYINQ